MHQGSKVAIGIPVHNGEETIASTIEAIVSQDWGDFEIIVSDNASTDATREIAETWAKRDKRILYRRHPQNIGACRNFVSLLRMASSELFMWASSGDDWRSDHLRRLVEELDRSPSAAFATSQIGLIRESGDRSNEFWHPDPIPTVDMGKAERLLHHLGSSNRLMNTYGHMVYGLFRKRILEECIPFWETLQSGYGADVILVLGIVSRGGMAFVPERTFWYREGGSSTRFQFRDHRGWMDYCAECSNNLAKVLDLRGLDFRQSMDVQRAMFRFLQEFTGDYTSYQESLLRRFMN